MTGLEFLAADVRFELPATGACRFSCPEDRRDLVDELRFEVATRVELVGDEDRIPRHHRAAYICETCGDPIGHDRRGKCVLCPDRCVKQATGLCVLCVMARDKALRLRKERERK